MKHNFSSSIQSSLDGRSSPDLTQLNQEKISSAARTSPQRATPVIKNEPATPEEPKRTKHPGGRPTKKSKGEEKRKKYSLTLLKATYTETLASAKQEGISFSIYVERAIEEYKKNH